MNFEDDNQKQIDKLERMERIYADAERHESVMDKIEEEEEEDICAFPRKIFKYVMILMWAACIFSILAGVDFLLPLCGILFSLGVFCALSVTLFLKKQKTADAVISVVVAVGCISLAILLLVKSPA
ncbi:MAG: hypothetical protein NC084_02350 [Bacteroides sp.]|nr:hypothetical protein [Eubacterium sp.]MCM1419530.1 hypothetical protein [Roseburia sp.]MCM1461537.1 hypothetical protein [Bacteroides sp.]